MGGEGWAELGMGAVLPYRALHGRISHCCRRRRSREFDGRVCWAYEEPRYCGDFDRALCLLTKNAAPDVELRWTCEVPDDPARACYVLFAWRCEWYGATQEGDAYHTSLSPTDLAELGSAEFVARMRLKTDPLLDALGYAPDAPEREPRFVAVSGRCG